MVPSQHPWKALSIAAARRIARKVSASWMMLPSRAMPQMRKSRVRPTVLTVFGDAWSLRSWKPEQNCESRYQHSLLLKETVAPYVSTTTACPVEPSLRVTIGRWPLVYRKVDEYRTPERADATAEAESSSLAVTHTSASGHGVTSCCLHSSLTSTKLIRGWFFDQASRPLVKASSRSPQFKKGMNQMSSMNLGSMSSHSLGSSAYVMPPPRPVSSFGDSGNVQM
mmetsp:Transcript_7135/g.15727  ORF Transcript_7135/g.15727 Transcript_7135/m.15727 type:complete len:224 (-) Transcript_7135:493-1164(-)